MNLPGFDLWLQNNPDEDAPEPDARHLAKALTQLSNCNPSDEEVYELACEIMQQEILDSQAAEYEHIADNFNDRRNEEY